MNFHLLTLFPNLVSPYLGESIVARAIKAGKIRVTIYDLKEHGGTRYRIDDKPYGGGPGMVIRAEPVIRAALSAVKRDKYKKQKPRIVILSPGGREFNNKLAEKWGKEGRSLVLIAGRYEGIDARVKKVLRAEEISTGPYTLTGGELPALVILDAVTRRLPDVLGDDSSIEEKRVSSHEVYTRPEVISIAQRQYRVPKILLSGHHQKIDNWKLDKKLKK